MRYRDLQPGDKFLLFSYQENKSKCREQIHTCLSTRLVRCGKTDLVWITSEFPIYRGKKAETNLFVADHTVNTANLT